MRLRLIALAVFLSVAPASAQVKGYRDVVTAAAVSDEGLFTVHRLNNRLLFEIPEAVLGRDMVVMSRIAKTQDGLGDGGANMAPNIVVRWERRDHRIVLRAVSHARTAAAGTPLELAVENANFAPVLASLPVQAAGEKTFVVDVTDLYLGDTPAFTLPRNRRTQLGVRSLDRERGWIEWARSFPINVEVR
ncbi:MAG: DUF5117 domain-containing protein, partial [Acidobacteria bacterium]|nr:DUF5117 domain-containing protein [Acidobacteriota bacterium]